MWCVSIALQTIPPLFYCDHTWSTLPLFKKNEIQLCYSLKTLQEQQQRISQWHKHGHCWQSVLEIEKWMASLSYIRYGASRNRKDREQRAQQRVLTVDKTLCKLSSSTQMFIWICKHILQTQHHKLCYVVENSEYLHLVWIYCRRYWTPKHRSPIKKVKTSTLPKLYIYSHSGCSVRLCLLTIMLLTCWCLQV